MIAVGVFAFVMGNVWMNGELESAGGPGIIECLQLLQGSLDKEDKTTFLRTQLAFFLLRATDGHAKNFSIFLRRGDAYEMTPLYDMLSIYPYFGAGPNHFNKRKAGPAMVLRSKNGHTHFYTIHARHWRDLAMANGGKAVWEEMLQLVESVDGALATMEKLLPLDFPARTWETISVGIREAAGKFLAEVGEPAPS